MDTPANNLNNAVGVGGAPGAQPTLSDKSQNSKII